MFKFKKKSFIMLLMSLLFLVSCSTIKINCELNLIWRDLVTVNVIIHNL